MTLFLFEPGSEMPGNVIAENVRLNEGQAELARLKPVEPIHAQQGTDMSAISGSQCQCQWKTGRYAVQLSGADTNHVVRCLKMSRFSKPKTGLNICRLASTSRASGSINHTRFPLDPVAFRHTSPHDRSLARPISDVRMETQSNDLQHCPARPARLNYRKCCGGTEETALGSHDDQHGYVLATIPATIHKKRIPTVELWHVDTAPDFRER
jgi:hypothetical protein